MISTHDKYKWLVHMNSSTTKGILLQLVIGILGYCIKENNNILISLWSKKWIGLIKDVYYVLVGFIV